MDAYILATWGFKVNVEMRHVDWKLTDKGWAKYPIQKAETTVWSWTPKTGRSRPMLSAAQIHKGRLVYMMRTENPTERRYKLPEFEGTKSEAPW